MSSIIMPNMTGCKIGAAGSTLSDITEIKLNGSTVWTSGPPATLNDCSWDEIRTMVRNGTLGTYFSLGDKKTFKLSTGENIQVYIASINDGTGSAGAYYPNHTADFVSYNHTSNEINRAYWYVYLDQSGVNWSRSDVRDILNNTIYNRLPQELRNVIIKKTHQYVNYIYNPGQSGYDVDKVICSDNLWLPTAAELNVGSYFGETSDYNKAYDISYLSNNEQRTIYNGIRLTSSLHPIGRNNIVIDGSGKLSRYYLDKQYLDVVIAFRIG